jgi:hypothetical protein
MRDPVVSLAREFLRAFVLHLRCRAVKCRSIEWALNWQLNNSKCRVVTYEYVVPHITQAVWRRY